MHVSSGTLAAGMQDIAPSGEVVPAPQRLQVVEPGDREKVPAGHGLHRSASSRPPGL